ncbi:nolO [Symbiodinium sp. CCMP2592]|nr:nolO [Symbiodinium sp. CCMP2592]
MARWILLWAICLLLVPPPASSRMNTCGPITRSYGDSLRLGSITSAGRHALGTFRNASAMTHRNARFRVWEERHEAKDSASSACRKHDYGFRLPSLVEREETVVLSIHLGHDTHLVLGIGGEIQCILELERYFGKRYYMIMGYGNPMHSPANRGYREEWLQALRVLRDRCECAGRSKCPTEMDYAVVVDAPGMLDMPDLVEQIFKVKEWRYIHHHDGHALFGHIASPFSRSLVVSYDGGGEDGVYVAYYGEGNNIHRIGRLDANFANAYHSLTLLMTEIYPEGKTVLKWLCERLETEPKTPWFPYRVARPSYNLLADAGKVMGYAAFSRSVRNPRVQRGVAKLMSKMLGGASFDPAARNESFSWKGFVPRELVELACESLQNQHDIAAELQRQWEERSRSLIQDLLERLTPHHKANQYIHDWLENTSEYNDVGVYIPPAPSDCGVAVGGMYSVTPPAHPQKLQYLGFRLWDEDTLEVEAKKRGAQQLQALGGVSYLAELLAGGPAWSKDQNRTEKPVIAVVRGRQEFGPRALGHRSLLAIPDSVAMKERMNRLKFRKWYRPIAPMIADEALVQVFGSPIKAPFMEKAPKVREEIRQKFPGMVHFDGTARHQSVGASEEPWIHQLLLAVGNLTGLAALINTSFNTRGKPIVNTVRESLEMLDTLPDLDYVLIEDYLFKAPVAKLPMKHYDVDAPARAILVDS